MAKFLKLTCDPSGSELLVNVDAVTAIRVIENQTFVFYQGKSHSIVKETPDQILKMIPRATEPALPWPWPPSWRNGWSPSPADWRHWHSNREWNNLQEVKSFDEAADALLRPIQTCQPSDRDKPAYDEMMKQAQEPLDGPPDM